MAQDPPSGAAVAQQAVSRALSVERQLKETAKQKSFFDPSMRALRASLRDDYVQILLCDLELAKSRDVDSAMWKTVFYKPIEEFRSRIRKAHESGPAAQELLKKATNTLLSFLRDAIIFYQVLIVRLQTVYGSVDVDIKLPSGVSVPDGPAITPAARDLDPSATVSRTLLYLGDLSRYMTMYKNGLGSKVNPKEWGPAFNYYTKASRVNPGAGQPHNQMAVLATYGDEELGAVYHYVRALAVDHPFLTARENLVLLFEKSRQRAALLDGPSATPAGKKQPPSGIGRSASRGQGPETKPSPATMVTRYVRAAGILFTKTSLETLPAVAAAAAADLEAVLAPNSAKGPPSGRQLLQLATVLIFSVHNAQWAPEGHAPGYSEMVQRGVLLRGSLAAFFTFMAKLARSLSATVLPQSQQPQPQFDSAAEPRLAALRVGVLWLLGNPSHATPGADPDQAEVASRAEFLQALTAFVGDLPAPPDTPAAVAHPLPEDRELKGFAPMKPAHAPLDFSLPPGEGAVLRQAALRGDLVRLAALLGSGSGDAQAGGLRGSSRGLLSTKEWKALKQACQSFCAACHRQPSPSVPSNGAVVEDPQHGARAPATRSASAPDVREAASDPMEEDALEQDEDEEVILFKPKAITRMSSPSLPQLLPPPAAAVAAPAQTAENSGPADLGPSPNPVINPVEVHAQHHQLWGGSTGIVLPAGPRQPHPTEPWYPQPSNYPQHYSLQGGYQGYQPMGRQPQPEYHRGDGNRNLADSMHDMGNSLVANLGLENSPGQPQQQARPRPYAGTTLNTAPPASALPLSSGLIGGSLFNFPPSDQSQAKRGVSRGLAPPGSGRAASSSFFGDLPAASAACQPAPSAQPASATGLGEAYGWLEALEAQQFSLQGSHGGASGILPPHNPYHTSNPFVP